MSMEVWKEFEHNEISHSIAHHLMAVDDLIAKQGYARVTDIARYLHITKGSASITLKNLKERGYVKEDANRFVQLTEAGAHTAHAVIAKRRAIITFLSEVIQVDKKQAEIDACKIEHLVSMKSGEKLLHFLQFVFSEDPTAKAFMTAFKDFQESSESCNLCEDECLFGEICDVEDLQSLSH